MTDYSAPRLRARAPALLAVVRERSDTRLAIAALAFAAVGLLAANEAAYFPPSWGWAALAGSWLVLLAVAMRSHLDVGPLDALFAGGVAALAVWIALSITWTRTVPQSVLELERTLVYVAAVAACLLMLRQRSVTHALGGVLGATTVIAGYSLYTRLFPDRFDNFDPIAGYRLTGPIGYWNALGIFTAMGVCLAIGFAVRGSHPGTRMASAAALVILVSTLYFTYSRGAWLALAVALVIAVAFDPRPLQLLAGILALAPAPAIAVAIAANSRGLTHTDTSIDVAADQGHQLALLLLPICAFAAASAAVLWRVQPAIIVPQRVRRALAVGLIAAAVGGALVGVATAGGPVSVGERLAREFEAPPVRDPNLNVRLFSLSGNGRDSLYQVAWDAFRARPLVGSGAGTYEQHWLRERPIAGKVRDAHSLYLETLSDLGVVGLLVLLLALAAPVAAAVVARRRPFVPLAFGAYAAFLIHAGIDWDWEMPAVTVAALICGAVLVVSARRERPRAFGTWGRVSLGAAAIYFGAFAFVGLIGNTEINRARDAIRARDFGAAVAPANKAIRWAPWSAEGWRRLGQAHLGLRQEELARRNLRKAISKDPLNWDRWFDLALATRGREQRRALARALELNPRSPELAQFIRGVGLKGLNVKGGQG